MPVNNRRPRRDDGCCSVHFLKYVLFIFTFIFYLAGAAVLGVGIWTLFWKSHYVALLATKTYALTNYILLGAGVAVLLVGIIGFVGVTKENRCCLLSFTFLLLVIFLLEAVAGILAYVYSEQVEKELQQSFQHSMTTKYSVDPEYTEAANLLYANHACCGAESFLDWKDSAWVNKTVEERARAQETEPLNGNYGVPDVCCRTVSPGCGRRDHPSNIYQEGCLPALKQDIQDHEIILGAIGLGVSTVQIFGMIISCCLYIKLKDFEDVQDRKKPRYY